MKLRQSKTHGTRKCNCEYCKANRQYSNKKREAKVETPRHFKDWDRFED